MSKGERGRYFSLSAGDTEFLCNKENFQKLVSNNHLMVNQQLTNRSSADGPANGTLISSLCNSCAFNKLCGPCRPMGPPKAPNGPANAPNAGIG